MADNYLTHSPTYQKTTKGPVRERHAAVALHLDEKYRPSEGRSDRVIILIQNEMGMRRGLSKHGFYSDFRLFRTIYEEYLTADEEQKERIIAEARADHDRDHSKKERDPILHAVWCLWNDGIRNKADVVRLSAQKTDGDLVPASYAASEDLPIPMGKDVCEAAPPENLRGPAIQNGDDRVAAMCALLTSVKDFVLELVQENMAFKEETARLGRERAFLNRLLAEYRERLDRAVVVDEKVLASAEDIARELDNTAWARTNRLPLHTNPEKWHGQTMEIVYGPMMRENFESKHWAPERKRVRDHLHRYAQEGRGHPSFHSKIFDTDKGDARHPGVPHDTRRYWYNRMSDGIRFDVEVKDRKLFAYNLNDKEDIS